MPSPCSSLVRAIKTKGINKISYGRHFVCYKSITPSKVAHVYKLHCHASSHDIKGALMSPPFYKFAKLPRPY